MTKFSVLDLVPIREGDDASLAMAHAATMAAHVEKLGFLRYWVAEHHGMPGIASAATAIVLAHVGAATSTIRLGAGGIMLPNHSPLVIAEQFGTLDALFPGRIDLGLGRAPGSDGRVAMAMRRNLETDPNSFPRDVMELRNYFTGETDTGVLAVPGRGADITMWILGSSLYGAQLAAMLGMPYAFASHFAPDDLDEAIALYRQQFRPSAHLQQPYVMLGFNIFAADTDAEAHYLASSMQQSFVALRMGTPGRLKRPVENYVASLDQMAQKLLGRVLQASSIGSADSVRRDLQAFIARTQADEILVTGAMFDQDKRKRSFEIVTDAVSRLEDSNVLAAA
jgi:luciferase family oxidoreductase group 1